MFNIYATDYAPVDPITPPCDIVPIFIGYKGENKARCLIFDLTECVETFGDGGFVISFIRQGDDLPYLVTDTDRLDNNAIWIITDTDTAVDGYGMVQLQYIVDDVVCKSALYRTVTFDSNSITGDVPDPYEDLLAQIAAYAAQAEGAATTATAAAQTATTAVEEGVKTERSQRIAADEGLNTRINELMGLAGAPSMANSAAAMTDSSKVYVYTGSEAGYLTGHWYYYNGTEWADGGVYQATAINTDKTLTVENMAADAAVVGDKIDECMAAFVVESTSGSIASFADGADSVPLKDLVVNIVPKQAGTGDPSPSNVRAISGWTGLNLQRAGKNLFDSSVFPATTAQVIVYIHYKVQNGTYTMSTPDFPLVGGIANVYFLAGAVSSGASSGSNGVSQSTFRTINVTDGYYTVAYRSSNDTNTNNPKNFKWQIELGSTATDYEPYQGNTYSVDWTDVVGTVYGGTLDVTSGMLTVTHALWTRNTSTMNNNENYPGWSNSGIKALIGSGYNQSFTAILNIGNRFNANTSENLDTLFFAMSIYGMTETEWKAKAIDVQILVELANPVSYQLTATEVRSLLGNNNIFADTGSVASCEYRADTKLYIEHLTDPDSDMIADSNITSGSYFMVNNNLYLATANIANGGAITPGTNCTATNLAAALNAINS